MLEIEVNITFVHSRSWNMGGSLKFWNPPCRHPKFFVLIWNWEIVGGSLKKCIYIHIYICTYIWTCYDAHFIYMLSIYFAHMCSCAHLCLTYLCIYMLYGGNSTSRKPSISSPFFSSKQNLEPITGTRRLAMSQCKVNILSRRGLQRVHLSEVDTIQPSE